MSNWGPWGPFFFYSTLPCCLSFLSFMPDHGKAQSKADLFQMNYSFLQSNSLPAVYIVGMLAVFLSLVIKMGFVTLVLEFLDRFGKVASHIKMAILVGLVGILGMLSSVLVIDLWSLIFWAYCDISSSESAYFSATSFTSLGSPRRTLVAPWRILEPLETGTGMLCTGIDTAMILTTISKVFKNTRTINSFMDRD